MIKDQFLEIYASEIHRPGADKLLQWLETTDFFTAPASTRFHLAREGGLAEHSLHVYQHLAELCMRESGVQIDPESVAICGLLHDVCKVNVYQQEPKNRKTYDPEKVAAAEP